MGEGVCLLIDFLLLVHAQLARAHVDQENKATTIFISCVFCQRERRGRRTRWRESGRNRTWQSPCAGDEDEAGGINQYNADESMKAGRERAIQSRNY